jgi:hypothetical protein
MQIIDRKNRDYYDHFSKIYGEDKSVTFDRSNSYKFKNKSDYLLFVIGNKKQLFSRNSINSILLLETGYFQYLLIYSKISWDLKDTIPINFKGELSKVIKFDEGINYFKNPLTLSHDFKFNYLSRRYGLWNTFKPEKINNLQQNIIVNIGNNTLYNPILSGTDIPNHIDSFEIWNNISNYISAQNNDKNNFPELTDKDKAINHGWEPVKYAFKPNIKN